MDTRQITSQAQLHSYLESLNQQCFNAFILLLYLYVKKHSNLVTNKQYFLSYKLIIYAYTNDKFYLSQIKRNWCLCAYSLLGASQPVLLYQTLGERQATSAALGTSQ